MAVGLARHALEWVVMMTETDDGSAGLTALIAASAPIVRHTKAREEFEVAHKAFAERLLHSSRVRWRTGQRLLASGNSIASFCQPLAEAHIRAAIAYLLSSRMRETLRAIEVPPPAWPPSREQLEVWAEESRITQERFAQENGRSWGEVLAQSIEVTKGPSAVLHACYQGQFFLVRAYQDRVYAAILELLGMESGPKASMGSAFKEGSQSPVGAFVRERCPAYESWFLRFRKIRNDLKLGTPTATTCSPDLDVGMYTVRLDEERKAVIADWREAFRLADASEALDQSRTLISSVRSLC